MNYDVYRRFIFQEIPSLHKMYIKEIGFLSFIRIQLVISCFWFLS